MEAVVAEASVLLFLLAAAEVHAGAEQLVLLAIRTTAGEKRSGLSLPRIAPTARCRQLCTMLPRPL